MFTPIEVHLGIMASGVVDMGHEDMIVSVKSLLSSEFHSFFLPVCMCLQLATGCCGCNIKQQYNNIIAIHY